jgi:zeaxanthin glucosyltransferase
LASFRLSQSSIVVSHFALLSPPLTSHARALEALAVALIDRGHRVTWLSQVDAQGLMRDVRIQRQVVGRETHPAGSLAAIVSRAASPGGVFGLRRVIQDVANATDMFCLDGRKVLRQIQADVVIADQMEAAGGLLAEALGLPCVSVACALPVNREPLIPLPVMPWMYDDSEEAQHRNRVSARLHDWLMAPHARVIQRHARGFGLPARATLAECLSPLLQISQTTAGFDFPRSQLPPHFHHVGPLRPPVQTEPPLGLTIDPSKPFVFASLGTLQGGRHALFRRMAKACRALDVQLLVAHCGGLTAPQAAALQAVGATWVTDFASQRAAVQAADVVITHAGLNTVMDALLAGKPMLALPIAFDQPGAAARLVHAGAGLRLSPTWATTGSIERRLRQLLTSPRFGERASALGAAVASAGGVQRAVDLIERAVSQHVAKEGALVAA